MNKTRPPYLLRRKHPCRRGLVPALIPTLMLAVAALWVTPQRPAVAGSTDPVLAIGTLRALPAGDRSVLEVTGIVGFDDILQIDFPLGLVVSQGDRFVHFVLGAEPESGSSAAIADGLAISDLPALEGAGTAEPDAEILELEPRRVLVSLPPSIVDGVVRATLYVTLPGEGTILSNGVSTSLLGVGDVR